LSGEKGWKTLCDTLTSLPFWTSNDIRAMLEEKLQPYAVNHGKKGTFTGYYIPKLPASPVKTAQFTAPLYGVPADMVRKNGKTGVMTGGRFKEYPTRAEIEKNGIDAPVLAWLEHKADVFVVHVQGSCVLTFPDGSEHLFGYAADNGRPFVGIGNVMLKRKALGKKGMSMKNIRDWLVKNGDKADEIMNQNPRYVFFKKGEGVDAVGSLGVPLTPKRSLAVDPSYIPLGSFLWLETRNPDFNRLMTAQDTGGAIKGAVRGDFFFGTGDEAFDAAAGMKASGTYFLLMPKKP
jgi:membrane-bound lytic murein transglycosylase A